MIVPELAPSMIYRPAMLVTVVVAPSFSKLEIMALAIATVWLALVVRMSPLTPYIPPELAVAPTLPLVFEMLVRPNNAPPAPTWFAPKTFIVAGHVVCPPLVPDPWVQLLVIRFDDVIVVEAHTIRLVPSPPMLQPFVPFPVIKAPVVGVVPVQVVVDKTLSIPVELRRIHSVVDPALVVQNESLVLLAAAPASTSKPMIVLLVPVPLYALI